MYYATHCIAPCLSILDGEAETVSCFGSGRIRDDLAARYGSPFAIETAHISIRNSDVVAEFTVVSSTLRASTARASTCSATSRRSSGR